VTAGTRIEQIENVIRDWLVEPGITLLCGDWQNGSVMEILPEGRAVLTRQKYAEPFSGLRDIHLPGQGHHLHLDLAKLSVAVYSVAPCVCYGYRPSFEVRFTDAPRPPAADGGAPRPRRAARPSGSFAFAFGVREPYVGGRANRAVLVPYFQRLFDHHARFPGAVQFRIEKAAAGRGAPPDGWADVHACLLEARGSEARAAASGPETLARAVRALLRDPASA
jgi:hypothetical protein